MQSLIRRLTPILIVAAIAGDAASAKNKQDKTKDPATQDAIVVDAHLTVPQGTITGFVFTAHYNRRYVYVQRAGGATPMLIDITKLDSPKLLSTLAGAGGAGSGTLLAVAGTAVVASSSAPAADKVNPQTIRIIDYSDAAHPKVTREFAGVTAVANQGDVTLLANPDGIWILSRKLAEDPGEEERYAREVIYGESRY